MPPMEMTAAQHRQQRLAVAQSLVYAGSSRTERHNSYPVSRVSRPDGRHAS